MIYDIILRDPFVESGRKIYVAQLLTKVECLDHVYSLRWGLGLDLEAFKKKYMIIEH